MKNKSISDKIFELKWWCCCWWYCEYDYGVDDEYDDNDEGSGGCLFLFSNFFFCNNYDFFV